jgi:hypothetical protein
MVALEARITKLDVQFIVRRQDGLSYTEDDHARALAFSLLASAELESFVEDRCAEVAGIGIQRFKTSQDSGTGRALLMWHISRKPDRAMPIHENDMYAHIGIADSAHKAYGDMVKGSHGIDGKDLLKLVFPLGVRDSGLPLTLTGSLETLAGRRNPASHSHVNRAKSLREPKDEKTLLDQIVLDLKALDDELIRVSTTFPC